MILSPATDIYYHNVNNMKKRIDESLRLKELAGINKLEGAPKKAMNEDFDDDVDSEISDKDFQGWWEAWDAWQKDPACAAAREVLFDKQAEYMQKFGVPQLDKPAKGQERAAQGIQDYIDQQDVYTAAPWISFYLHQHDRH